MSSTSNPICDDYEDQVSVIVAVGNNPDDLNNALSFPYPEQQTTARAKGQGCQSCVHGTYCPALYWFKRNNEERPDEYTGIKCASWSNDPADKTSGSTNSFDSAENARRACSGVLMEANRNGISVGRGGDR